MFSLQIVVNTSSFWDMAFIVKTIGVSLIPIRKPTKVDAL